MPGNSFWTTATTTTTSATTTSTTVTTTTSTTVTSTTTITATTTTIYNESNVDCVEEQDNCTTACERKEDRNYKVTREAMFKGRACRNASDCEPGDGECPTTSTTTPTTTTTTTVTTSTTSTTTTATTTTVTTTTKLLDINERCDPRNDQCKKCHGLTSFNDTCNPDYDLKCDRESNNECRYVNANATKSSSPVPATKDPEYFLSILGSALALLSVAIASSVLAYNLRNAEDKWQACLQFFKCVDKGAPLQIDDEVVDRLEVIMKAVTLSSSGGGDSSPAVPRTATLEKYRRRLAMYYSNDGVLGADEIDALKDEFGKENITVIEHDTLLAEIVASTEIVSSSSDEELASNDSDGGVDAAVSFSSDDDDIDEIAC